MKTLFAFLLAASFTGSIVAGTLPHVTSVNPAELAAAKSSYQAGSDEGSSAARAIRAAEKALKMDPVTVTSKTQAPEGGSMHDYVSLAPYWWPDPAAKDGLPYIRRDGEVNPERELYHDREHFGQLVSAVGALSSAHYFTADERFAEHATRLLSAWFLDSATCMNPSLNFAQAIRGRNAGRGAGLIEMHMLPRILDAIGLLEGSQSWTPAKQRAMTDWCSRYYAWLNTSPIGRDEFRAPNNHGSWYDVQRASVALFIGKTEEAKKILEEAKTRRIASEIEPDGTQPKELVRTKSMGYCTFNLIALTTLATIGSTAGVDLWHFATADGRGIQKAIDYMAPFYAGKANWDHKQIIPFDWNEALEMLTKANPFYDGAYDAVLAAVQHKAEGKKKK
jgi:hypothetical protein